MKPADPEKVQYFNLVAGVFLYLASFFTVFQWHSNVRWSMRQKVASF